MVYNDSTLHKVFINVFIKKIHQENQIICTKNNKWYYGKLRKIISKIINKIINQIITIFQVVNYCSSIASSKVC